MAKKGTFPANAMRRGEIYWVDIPNAIGHELMKDRPAIIVSCDALNDNSPVVQVVYCSASPKKELPEHITIRSTEQISTALCENVYTVDKSRVGRFVGRCTRREMEQVDLGLLSGLGLAQYGLASPQEDEEEPEPVRGDTEDGTASMALVIAQTERDTYKRMYESLLARMTMEREETAWSRIAGAAPGTRTSRAYASTETAHVARTSRSRTPPARHGRARHEAGRQGDAPAGDIHRQRRGQAELEAACGGPRGVHPSEGALPHRGI